MCGKETNFVFPVELPSVSSPLSLAGDGSGSQNNMDYAAIDKIVKDSTPRRDFEINVQYATQSGVWDLTITKYISSGVIGPGKVLIGEYVYTTQPVYFSGDVTATLNAYKLKNDITKDVYWRVFVDVSAVNRKWGEHVRVLNRFSHTLFVICGGHLQHDYRYLPHIATGTDVISGNISYHTANIDGGGSETQLVDCYCPSAYDYLKKKRAFLVYLNTQLADYLKQRGLDISM